MCQGIFYTDVVIGILYMLIRVKEDASQQHHDTSSSCMHCTPVQTESFEVLAVTIQHV